MQYKTEKRSYSYDIYYSIKEDRRTPWPELLPITEHMQRMKQTYRNKGFSGP